MTGAKIGVNTTKVNTDITKAGGGGGGHGLGDQHIDENGDSWVFVIASNTSITQYDTVLIKSGYDIIQMTIDDSKTAGDVGFAQVAFAPNTYGWVMTHSRPTVLLGADCQPSVQLYATTTGGLVDDTTTSAKIQGLQATTSVTGATTSAACVATYPQVSWRDASST